MEFNTVQSNPWDQEDERRYGSTKRIFAAASELGYKLDVPVDADLQLSSLEKYDSVRMLSLMSDIQQAEDKLYQINRLIDRTIRDKDTYDLTSLGKIESRLTQLASLSSHLGNVVEHKGVVTSRLQQPYSGENLLIDASQHKHVVEFFSVISRLLSDLNSLLDTITWASTQSKQFNKSTDQAILRLNAALTNLQSHVDNLQQLQKAVTSLTVP